MYSPREIKDRIAEIQKEVDGKGLDVNVASMYQCFYEQRRRANGSSVEHIGAEEYAKKMQEWCTATFKSIDEAIEKNEELKLNIEGPLRYIHT